MLELNCRLDVTIGSDEVIISIHDRASQSDFFRCVVPGQAFLRALGRMSGVPCKVQLDDRCRMGMTRECKTFSIPVAFADLGTTEMDKRKSLEKVYVPFEVDGWEADRHWPFQVKQGVLTTEIMLERYVPTPPAKELADTPT